MYKERLTGDANNKPENILWAMLKIEAKSDNERAFQEAIAVFLSEHIITPVESLKHPYARELIAYVSGIECQIRAKGALEWNSISINDTVGPEWRIKPE